MKRKKTNANLMLFSVITASTLGVGQATSSTTSALGSENNKELANDVWKQIKIPVIVGASMSFIKLISKIPSNGKVSKYFWKALKGIGSATYTAWSLLPESIQFIAGITVVTAISIYMNNIWDEQVQKAASESQSKKKNAAEGAKKYIEETTEKYKNLEKKFEDEKRIKENKKDDKNNIDNK